MNRNDKKCEYDDKEAQICIIDSCVSDTINPTGGLQNSSSGFVRILIRILSVSILPVLIISFLLNHLVFSYTRQNYLLSMSQSLASYSASLDESIRGVEKMMAVVGSDEDVISFVIDPDPDNYHRNTRIIDAMNSLVSSYDFISSIYLYSSVEGLVLSSNGGLDSITTFTDTGWVDAFNSHFLGIQRLPTRVVKDRNSKTLSVISLIGNLPSGSWDKSAGLVVNINREKLFSGYHQLYEGGHQAYVLNDTGYILDHPDSGRIGNFSGDDPVLQLALNRDSGYFVRKEGGSSRVMAFASAAHTRWVFVYQVGLGELLSLERRMLLINSFIILLAVASIFIVVIRISMRMYLPVQMLDSSTRQLENALPIMQANVLHHLLTNKLNGEADFSSALDLIGIKFIQSRFVVLVFGIDHYRRIVVSRDQVSLRLLKSTLRQRIGDAVPSGVPNICAEREGGNIGLLLNISDNSFETERLVLTLSRKVIAMVKRGFTFSVTCGIGQPCSSLKEVHLSYDQARTALGFRLYDGGGTVIESSRFEESGREAPFPGPEMEKTLINCVENGNEKDVPFVVDSLMERIRGFSSRDTFAVREVFNRIAARIKEISCGLDLSGESECSGDLYAELADLETLDEIYAWLIPVCTRAAREIKHGSLEKTGGSARNIAAYIDENLDNPGLSLVDIGDAVGLSASYVSRVFKEHYGTNYVDYLNRRRVDSARELLKQMDLPVHQVASMAGFANLQTFIRVFKKYEGLSPGRYRSAVLSTGKSK